MKVKSLKGRTYDVELNKVGSTGEGGLIRKDGLLLAVFGAGSTVAIEDGLVVADTRADALGLEL